MSGWVDQPDRDWADALMRMVQAMSADDRRLLAINIRTDVEGMPPGPHRECVAWIASAINRIADEVGTP